MPTSGTSSSSIGAFINGLEARHINYDARERDKSIEQSRAAACGAIRNLIQFLEMSESLRRELPIWIRMEDADAHEVGSSLIPSSITRELQALSSHTIHHFALIAITLRLHGVKIEADFGVAPSTLRYRASRTATRAEAA